MDESIKLLTKLLVDEYKDAKSELGFVKAHNERLSNLNESLMESEQDSAKKFARLKKLLAPKVSWSNTGEPLGVALFDSEMAKEICEILKIEEHEAK